jgi:hypothetical protein
MSREGRHCKGGLNQTFCSDKWDKYGRNIARRGEKRKRKDSQTFRKREHIFSKGDGRTLLP